MDRFFFLFSFFDFWWVWSLVATGLAGRLGDWGGLFRGLDIPINHGWFGIV